MAGQPEDARPQERFWAIRVEHGLGQQPRRPTAIDYHFAAGNNRVLRAVRLKTGYSRRLPRSEAEGLMAVHAAITVLIGLTLKDPKIDK